ncbi:MAG: anti-sigma factor [Sphingomicrobium sp.]
MTTDNLTQDGPDPDVGAAELALGLLEGDDRTAALRRQLANPDFARDVERWRDHFATLFAAWPEEQTTPSLDARILGAANDPGSASLRRWKWFGAGSSVVAAALAVLLVARPPARADNRPTATVSTTMVAAFAPAEGAPMPARYDLASHSLTIGGDMPLPADRNAQLWALGKDGSPRPLGVLRQIAPGQLVADATAVPIPAGTVLAISIEPVGGSPTGSPTGPVIATATLTEI